VPHQTQICLLTITIITDPPPQIHTSHRTSASHNHVHTSLATAHCHRSLPKSTSLPPYNLHITIPIPIEIRINSSTSITCTCKHHKQPSFHLPTSLYHQIHKSPAIQQQKTIN
jgi:hypothetical protein